ncbi:hypothetical protein [Rufibacter ruber]|uniref:hypothetical protein n=1 Tax=Rufibacter ruber TaxID=1783499 RepID=UPI00082A3D55|nr:hypothetical protein [Rufibacter ruber]
MKQTPLPVSDRVVDTSTQRGGWSAAGRHNRYLRTAVDFFYAETAFRAFTFLWLYWAMAKFELLLERPRVLYTPMNAIAESIAPVLPAKPAFWAVLCVAAVANLAKIFCRQTVWLQGLLVGCLLWANLVLWGYGFLSHINHVFLLAHLFLVWVAVEKPSNNPPSREQFQTINWFYLGLLFTYTLAGLWKVGALGRKLLMSSGDVHWLKPEAALYNALVSFRDYDQPFPYAQLFLGYPWVWQVGFVLVVYLQVASVFAAWRPALRPWVGFFLVCFHLLNQFAFLIFFKVTCLVLLCLFFPYSWLLPAYRRRKLSPAHAAFQGKFLAATYKRLYANGEEDSFNGFEAYRQLWVDTYGYAAGIFYLPGINTAVSFFMRVFRGGNAG